MLTGDERKYKSMTGKDELTSEETKWNNAMTMKMSQQTDQLNFKESNY